MSAVRVATRASTVAEFVEAFCRFTDEESIFLPVAEPLPLGRQLSFRVTLVDGTAVMNGEGEVVESISDRLGSFGRNGMRLRLVNLSEDALDVHRDLLSRRERLGPRALPGVAPGPGPVLGEGSKVGVPSSGAKAAGVAAIGAIRELEPGSGRHRLPTGSGVGVAPVAPAAPASGTLPANPFAALSAEALEHFVDCSIFEDTGAPPEEFDEPDEPSLPPARRSFTRFSSESMPMPVTTPLPTALDAPNLALDPPFGDAFTHDADDESSDEASADDVTTGAAEATASAVAAPRLPAPAPRRSMLWLAGGVSAAWLVVGALLGWVMWGRRGDPVASVSRPMAVDARIVVPPEPAEAPAAVAPPVPAPLCRVTILTDRPGVVASVGTDRLGSTPVRDAEVDCHGTLVLEHPRYKRIERPLALEPGSPATVRERLERPEALLTIQSTPPGALVTVNGKPVGAAPVTVPVTAFEESRVTASTPEYKPWSKTVYVKGEQTVDIQLQRRTKKR